MADFVVNRNTWRCGISGKNSRGLGTTYLLNLQGFMCCLGQTCKQVGVPDKKLLEKSYPDYVKIQSDEKPIRYFTKKDKNGSIINTKLSQKAIRINDDSELTPEVRERKLKSLFSKFKHKLEFVGEYNNDN